MCMLTSFCVEEWAEHRVVNFAKLRVKHQANHLWFRLKAIAWRLISKLPLFCDLSLNYNAHYAGLVRLCPTLREFFGFHLRSKRMDLE